MGAISGGLAAIIGIVSAMGAAAGSKAMKRAKGRIGDIRPPGTGPDAGGMIESAEERAREDVRRRRRMRARTGGRTLLADGAPVGPGTEGEGTLLGG